MCALVGVAEYVCVSTSQVALTVSFQVYPHWLVDVHVDEHSCTCTALHAHIDTVLLCAAKVWQHHAWSLSWRADDTI